jgi:predicted outer membrane repeat protein
MHIRPIGPLLVLALAGIPGSASASGCTVPGTHTTIDAAADDGACDVVQVGPGIFSEALTINRNVTVRGAGAGATLEDVTVAGGSRGIDVEGTLTARRVAVSGNTGTSDVGIIVYDSGGPATLRLEDSLVSNNHTTAGNGGGLGAQINSVVTVVGSTFTLNTATGGDGGAIYNALGTLTVTNSTISGNTSTEAGGGIATSSSSTATTFSSATIAGNTADSDMDDFGDAGGLYRGGGTVELRNTIIAGNIDGSPTPANRTPDCSVAPVSLGNNLIGDPSGCAFTPGSGDITGAPTQLLPLDHYGGPTPTHALPPASPAIDAGNAGGCGDGVATLATDQRGQQRAVDGNGDGTARCDIGAYEYTAKTLDLSAKPRKVRMGKKTRLRAEVTPCAGHEGDLVEFRKGSKLLASVETGADCTATRKVRVMKKTTFRAVSPAQDSDHGEASDSVKVRVRKP